jgi:hypothetical protein
MKILAKIILVVLAVAALRTWGHLVQQTVLTSAAFQWLWVHIVERTLLGNAAALWLTCMALACYIIYLNWRSGQLEITSVLPKTTQDRARTFWTAVAAVNFAAIVVHAVITSTCAFPDGGRFEGGQYLVPSHGREISFTPVGYWFSYIHGVVFVILHLVCGLAILRVNLLKDFDRSRRPQARL